VQEQANGGKHIYISTRSPVRTLILSYVHTFEPKDA